VSIAEYERRHGEPPDARFGDILREFEGHCILERTATHLRLTRRGRLLSNELFQRLLPEPATA